MKINRLQQPNILPIKEVGALFIDLLLSISLSYSPGSTKDEVVERTRLQRSNIYDFSGAYPNAIPTLVDRFWAQAEDNDHTDDWEKYCGEFRIFLQGIGIRLKDFDRAVRKALLPGRDRQDFERFITCYYLLTFNINIPYIVDSIFSTVTERAWKLYIYETGKLSQELSLALGGYLTQFDYKDLLLKQDASIIKSNILSHIVYHSHDTSGKAEFILTMPYICGESEYFIAYLFNFKSEELSLMLYQILDALLDIIMGGYNPSAELPL